MNKAFIILIILAAVFLLVYRNLSIIFLIMANRKYSSGNMEETLKWYEKAYKHKYSSPNTKIMYAYLLLRQGYAQKAEKILKTVMKGKLSEKDKISAVLNLSIVYWKKGNLDEAISLLQKLYDEGYKTTVLYQNLGYYLILKGDYHNALKFNLEAYDYSSDDASLLDNLAMNYYYMGDYDKAIEIYDKFIPKNPSFVSAYYYYGKTLIKQKKYEQALESLKKALDCSFSFITAITKEDVKKEINNIKKLLKPCGNI